MSNSKAELRAYHKQRFVLFLVLSIVCAVLFAGLIVYSFFLPLDNWLFWVILFTALAPLAGAIISGKAFNSHLRSIQELDLQKRKR